MITMPDSKPNIALRPEVPADQARILQSILGAVDVGIMLTDLEHSTLAVNERFGQIFRIPIEETIRNNPESVRELVRDRIVDFDAWRENLAVVYQDPTFVQEDVLILQNPYQVLDRKTSPVLDDNLQPIARLWTFSDITSRHHRIQIESLLHELSTSFDPNPRVVYDRIVRSLAEFYDSTSILSIMEGERMNFQSIASTVIDVSDQTGNELQQSYCQFCIGNDGPTIIQNALDDPIQGALMPVKLGVTRYAGVPLRSPEGDVFGTLCVLDHHSDRLLGDDDLRLLGLMAMRISGELLRENHLNRLQQDLAHAQSQMIQNEKLAVTGTLAASIAHDIRNIVSAITIDLDSDFESPTDRLLRAKTHIHRFNVLALRLLSYAKPKEVSRQRFGVSESILKIYELLSRHLQISRIDFDAQIPDDLPEIEADPGRVEHLFMNLCLNALQAMKSGGRLTILGSTDESSVIIEVKDDGGGMSQEQIDSAFQPFSSSRPDGFGLGLYSCQQIMREAGGTIAVDSSPSGTTFTLRFPKT
jgi:signal transduction histidine kinase